MSKPKLFIEEYRDLSAIEVDLIRWLLAVTNNSEFIEQVEKTKVISKCGCGCRTIDLQVEGYDAKSGGLNLSAQGISPEGVPVDVVLHIRHGLISELEVYSMNGINEFGLPEIDQLHID